MSSRAPFFSLFRGNISLSLESSGLHEQLNRLQCGDLVDNDTKEIKKNSAKMEIPIAIFCFWGRKIINIQPIGAANTVFDKIAD